MWQAGRPRASMRSQGNRVAILQMPGASNASPGFCPLKAGRNLRKLSCFAALAAATVRLRLGTSTALASACHPLRHLASTGMRVGGPLRGLWVVDRHRRLVFERPLGAPAPSG
eukprot:365530-Chlamydomonas_euryale.AAC.26